VVNADQTPDYADIRKAGHDGGDFLFVPIDAAPATVAAAPALDAGEDTTRGGGGDVSQTVELAYWQSIEDSTDPAMFDAYIAEFPDGTFAELARLKRDALLADVVPEAQVAATNAATDGVIPPPPPESPREVAAIDPALPTGSPKEQYSHAHRVLQAGQIDRAQKAFQAFIKAHPTHDLTDNAYFWLGETFSSLAPWAWG